MRIPILLFYVMFVSPMCGQIKNVTADSSVVVSNITENKQKYENWNIQNSSSDAIQTVVDSRSTTTYIQNETITGPVVYDSNIIKVGSDVTTSKAKGPVTFKSGTITLTGSEITFHPQTTISKETEFKLIIKK